MQCKQYYPMHDGQHQCWYKVNFSPWNRPWIYPYLLGIVTTSLNNYFFPWIHFVHAIDSYVSFTIADEDYWNALLVTLLWKITNGWYPSPATKKENTICKSSRNVIFVFIILNNWLSTYTLIKSESTFSK